MSYDFLTGITAEHFHRKGFRPTISKDTFKIIVDVDFSKLVDDGIAFITQEDAYVTDGTGRKDPVYFYKKRYKFFYDVNIMGTPKFHILKCQTILQHGVNSFQASNTPTATVINSNQFRGERSYNLTLTLCGNCKREIVGTPEETTEQFYERLKARYEEEQGGLEDIKIDLKGYPLDWPQISKKYRKSVNYTCEHPACQLQIQTRGDQKFLHTHHRNGNKIDNRPANFQCLCILCHSKEHEQDAYNKFERASIQREIKSFLKRYGVQLKQLGNPYV